MIRVRSSSLWCIAQVAIGLAMSVVGSTLGLAHTSEGSLCHSTVHVDSHHPGEEGMPTYIDCEDIDCPTSCYDSGSPSRWVFCGCTGHGANACNAVYMEQAPAIIQCLGDWDCPSGDVCLLRGEGTPNDPLGYDEAFTCDCY